MSRASSGSGGTVQNATAHPGQQGRCALLAYLDWYRLPDLAACGEQERRSVEPLFLSETGRPLTEEAVALVFGRLRERAGISRGGVTPSLLCETFAVRYLQTGDDPEALQEILGIKEREAITRYERLLDQLHEKQKLRQYPENHLF